MRPIIPHTLVLGLSESLIALSMCPVVFSKLIPKVCENLDALLPSGRAYLRTVTHPTCQDMIMTSIKCSCGTSTSGWGLVYL